MTEPTQHLERPRCHTLLAWCVSLFVAAYAVAPAHAQAVAPADCADPAEIVDDGDDADMITDGDSVAVGCGSEVGRNVVKMPYSGITEVVILDRGNDGTDDLWLLKINCDDAGNAELCKRRDENGDVVRRGDGSEVREVGIQYADIGQELYDRLVEADQMGLGLSDEEQDDIRVALRNLQPLNVIDTPDPDDESLFKDRNVSLSAVEDTTMEEVTGVAVGADANVKANGGIAIGDGATVGTDVTTTRTLERLELRDESGNPIIDESGNPVTVGVYVDLEEEADGGGGVNGIAIGNGATATGDGSIAIGNGAVAMEDGQVMIGTHDIGAMHEGVMENAAGVAENKEDIAENATDIATNAAGVAENKEDIAENATDIATNAAGVATNAAGVATNAAGVAENKEDIAENATDIATNAAGVATNAAGVATNAAGVAENKEDIAENATDIATNAAGVATNAAGVATNAAGVAENKEDIAENATDIATNATGVAENKEDIAENATDIATNATGVADNRTMIGANSMRLDGHDADLAANRNQLNQHAAMLSQHADSIQNNTMQIKMLDERVNQVAAMAAALSAVPNAPDRDERFFLGIGMGSHDGESSVAAGLAGRLGANKNIVINAGVANSGGGTTVRAGIGWSF